MSFRIDGRFRSGVQSFNMTPIIDVVFLLIIFFLIVCQFIEAENFPIAVPDGCEFAQNEPEARAQQITVTVMKTAKGRSCFAVGSEEIAASSYAGVVEAVAGSIDVRLKELPPEGRVVTLRIDKDVCFSEAQYALAGVAASNATDIQLAALKNKRTDLE
jgi:biopolymer transport protein ExbD